MKHLHELLSSVQEVVLTDSTVDGLLALAGWLKRCQLPARPGAEHAFQPLTLHTNTELAGAAVLPKCNFRGFHPQTLLLVSHLTWYPTSTELLLKRRTGES